MPLSSTSSQKDVSIIIPVFNRCDLTERCLESIARSASHASYEVIVVDNASTDRTAELLADIDGDITVITNKTNEGFASACNRGARLANGEYLLFLNNDTEVADDFLDKLIHAAEQTSSAGAVGCKLLFPDGKTQHAGIAFNEENTPYHIFHGFPADHPAVNTSREMAAVTAACMLIKHATFESAGRFDTSYRNGFEDVDLCLKLKQRGYKNIYCADCEITHHEESSEGRKVHDAENMLLFATRWGGTSLQDDEKYLAAYGLTIRWGKNGGRYENVAPTTTTDTSLESLDGQTLLDLAQKKYLEGKHDEAAQVLNRIVAKHLTIGKDDEFETWQLLGNCMARLNRAEDAEKAYLQAAEANMESERPFLGLGSVAMLQENWTAAQYGFLAALSRNPNTMRAEFGLGISLAARNQHENAVKHFKRVVSQDPRNSEAVFYLYRSAMETSQPQVAIAALSQYLENCPEDVDFWFHLSGALWKAESLDDAIDVCKKVLEMNPQHVDAQSTLRYMEQRVAATV
ncbi:MAG: glycosyltransferase [bacterium]|nr:glycosyltransferase [bacterium]